MIDDEEFTLVRPMPLALRLMLAAAGLFAIIMPAWEFRQVFLHPTWLSLFFAVITLGAWSVGGAFVAAAIFGEDQRWTVRDGEIEIARRAPWRASAAVIRGADVSVMSIEETSWDSGPNTYSVALRLRGGEKFETPGFEKRDNAQELETRLRQRLHLT